MKIKSIPTLRAPLSANMFDDDDDVEPPVTYVDDYYFEESENEPVCFSVLPIKFDENEGRSDCKEVDLRGHTDNNLRIVFKKVVAWRVELDCHQPKISVLSSVGNWIELLKPRNSYYEKKARSILSTVQMLHFVRKWPRKQKKSLFYHLNEVFCKFGTRPNEDDIRRNHHLIKRFMERDPIVMKSKVVRSFIEDAAMKATESTPRRASTKERFIVSDESLASTDDSDDSDYGSDENSDDNADNNTDEYTDTDGNTIDDGTDIICAICDDGGRLLGCEGRCKRSFHPRKKDGIHPINKDGTHPTKKDGRKYNCKTLCFTSAQLKLKESGTYLCVNCEYNEHQCFKCGELEPSYGPNAKVFQCNKESCGHFYHPKCIAVLLEPKDTDGACKLEERIADGMPFTCPVHWCFKCGKMEDRTQEELQFAVCRRCPRSYHIACLPRHHGLDATIGTPRGEHIKFPSVPKKFCSVPKSKTIKNLAKEDVEVTGKRKKKANQFSTKSTELANVSPRGESKQIQRTARNSSSEDITLKNGCAVKRLKKDLQFELPMAEVAASLRGRKTVEGKEEQPGNLSSLVMGIVSKSASGVVDDETEKRVTSTAEKETTAGTSQDMATKGVLRQPSRIEAEGMFECFVQIADKLHWYVKSGDTIVNLCFNIDNFSQLMKEKLEDVCKRCNFKNCDLFHSKKDLCFEENWLTMQPQDLPHGSNLVMVLDLPLDIQAVSANKLVDKVLTLKPSLIMIVSPTDIERLNCKEEPYHLIWEDNEHIFGKPLCQPSGVDVNGEAKNGWHVIPLSLSLWGCLGNAEENRRIAGKHGHLNVGRKTICANEEHSVMLKNPPVDNGAKWDSGIFTAGKEDSNEREQTSEHYAGKQLRIPNGDSLHANQQQNDLQSFYKEKHANGGGGRNKSRSEKETDTYQGENACGHYSVARQETEISNRQNIKMKDRHDGNTRSGKEKIPRDISNKGTLKPDLADGLPPEKHVEVAFVHKTTTNRADSQHNCIYNVSVDVNGSHASQHEPKSPHCNDNTKGTENTSGDNSRKTREQREVTDAKRLDLDGERKVVHMKIRRDAHHKDDRTAHPQVHSDPQRIDNHISDVLDCSLRSDVNRPLHNDDQRAEEASVCNSRKSKKAKNSSRHQLQVERRKDPDRSNDYSSGWGRMDENYPTANNQRKHEQFHHGDYSNNGKFDRMRRSSHQPALRPANSDVNRSHSPYAHPARHRSPSYPRRPGRSEHAVANYETDCRAVPHRGSSPDTEYDVTGYNTKDDGYATGSGYGYHAMGTLPVDRYHHPEHNYSAYQPQTNFGEEQPAAIYGRHGNDYERRPYYHRRKSFDWEQSSARGTVTDRYAPQLEYTNHQIPGQGGLHDDYFQHSRNRFYTNMHRPYN
uniref:Zinc finger PHD-type domain-containing protein n=1 Tax=Leersia perrieri TaxID=77586 RepID=A0A0D9X6T4_9ORYZ